MIHRHENKMSNRINGQKTRGVRVGESYKFSTAAPWLGCHVVQVYLHLFVLSIRTGNFQMCICQTFSVASWTGGPRGYWDARVLPTWCLWECWPSCPGPCHLHLENDIHGHDNPNVSIFTAFLNAIIYPLPCAGHADWGTEARAPSSDCLGLNPGSATSSYVHTHVAYIFLTSVSSPPKRG